MRSDAMSVLGLAFQSAKVVKRNITVMLTYYAHVFQSDRVIFRFTTQRKQADVIISERKGCKNFFIAFLLLLSYFTRFLISILSK